MTMTPANAVSLIEKNGGGTVPRLLKIGGVDIAPVEDDDRGLCIGIFAPGGTGKTTTAATITESEHAPRALWINARGNPHVVSHYGDAIDVAELPNFAANETIRKEILRMSADDCPWHTVVHDTMTTIWSRRLRDLYGPIADIDWTKHSATTADLIQYVNNWMDLADSGPKLNQIFIFQEVGEARKIRGQDIASRSEIAVNKALQSQLPGIINFLGRLYIEGDEEPYRRVLDFRPIESMHQSKFQVSRKHPATKDVPMVQYNPHIGHLLDTVRYGEPWPTDQHTRQAKPSR